MITIKQHPKTNKFNNTYDKLSKPEKNDLAIKHEKQPYSWNMIKIEVDNNTVLSHELLTLLTRHNKI
jgi:hypothetical protein